MNLVTYSCRSLPVAEKLAQAWRGLDWNWWRQAGLCTGFEDLKRIYTRKRYCGVDREWLDLLVFWRGYRLSEASRSIDVEIDSKLGESWTNQNETSLATGHHFQENEFMRLGSNHRIQNSWVCLFQIDAHDSSYFTAHEYYSCFRCTKVASRSTRDSPHSRSCV